MRLFIVGEGDVADALGEIAGRLGYDEIHRGADAPASLTRDDHVVVCSGGRAVLSRVLAAGEPSYLGVVSSEAEALAAVPKERIDRISAPAGLPLGAETADERAIAIAAELVATRRRKAKN